MDRRIAVIGLVVAGLAAGGIALLNGKKSEAPTIAVQPVSAEADGVATEVDRTIDWSAAAAKAGANRKTLITAQSVGLSVDSPVPILALPTLSEQSVESGKTTMKATSDGYFAAFPGPKYDVVVTGTKKAYKVPEAAPDPVVTTQSVDEFNYSQTDTGAEVTFSQFGADYLVQFECKKPDETKSCISETDARAVVEGLILVGK